MMNLLVHLLPLWRLLGERYLHFVALNLAVAASALVVGASFVEDNIRDVRSRQDDCRV